MTLLSAHHLSIGYRLPLQKDISFVLENGQALFIKGDNGVGKSTLVKTLMGELPALEGRYQWGIPVSSCAHLPQTIGLDFPLSVTLGEILESFDIVDSIKELLPGKLHDRRWQDASGGERQKTLILSRLQKNTRFLVLDEPFNHLDKKTVEKLSAFLFDLIQNNILQGMLLISHITPFSIDRKKIVELHLT